MGLHFAKNCMDTVHLLGQISEYVISKVSHKPVKTQCFSILNGPIHVCRPNLWIFEILDCCADAF